MPLVDLVNNLASAWEAASPPSYDRRPYRRVQIPGTGASAHRTFWFEVSSQAHEGVTQQSSSQHVVRHRFEARIAFHLPDRKTDIFERFYREYQTLSRLAYTVSVPAQCRAPTVITYRPEEPEEGDEGDVDLVLVIEAETVETS